MAKEIDPRVAEWLIEGKTQKQIALELGVSQPTVSRIVKRLKTSFNEQQTLPESPSMIGSNPTGFSVAVMSAKYDDTNVV
jgi:predicted transcriptional regulator